MRERIDDSELLYMYREDPEDGCAMILDKYEILLSSYVRRIIGQKNHSEYDEAMAMGQWSMITAVESYREDMNCGFQHFMRICMERELYSVAKSVQKRMRYEESESVLKGKEAMYEEDTLYLGDLFPNHHQYFDPVFAFYYRQLEQQVNETVQKLKKEEQMVLELYLSGKSYKEISNQLGIKEKTVDNRLQKVKKKIFGSFD